MDEIFAINAFGKFLVKTKDREFSTTIYPFLQTDYLVDELLGKAYRFPIYRIMNFCTCILNSTFSIPLRLALSKARQNFANPSTYSYEDFSFKVVRIFFDQLHGVRTNVISLEDALELMVFCNHLGQIDQKSNWFARHEVDQKIFGRP